MRNILIAIFLFLTVLPGTPGSAQHQAVRLGPSTVLTRHRDAIDDTDFSSMRIESLPSGAEASLVLGCYGRITDAHVNFGDDRDGTLFIFRFNSEKPDSFPQVSGPAMRMWGDGRVRLVTNAPTGIANLPSTAIPRFVRGLRTGGRLVVRRQGARGINDAWFDLTGAARGLDQLSCLSVAPRQPPRVLGRSNDDGDNDTDPSPADSAAVAVGLDVLRPLLDREILPYVFGTAYVSETGTVDSVSVYSIADEQEDQYRAYIRALRFQPAQRQGAPVRSQWMFRFYKSENVPRP